MNFRHPLGLLLIGVGLVIGPPELSAQPHGGINPRDRPSDDVGSHIPIPLAGGLGDVEAQLGDRLGGAQQLSDLQNLLKQVMENPANFGLDLNDLKRLQASGQIDTNNPGTRELIGKMLERTDPEVLVKKDPSLTPQKINKLKEEFLKPAPKEGDKPPAGGGTGGGGSSAQSSNAKTTPKAGAGPSGPAPSENGRKISKLASRLQEYVKTFQRRNSALGQSSTIQETVRKLTRGSKGAGGRKSGSGSASSGSSGKSGGGAGPSLPGGNLGLGKVGSDGGGLFGFKGGLSLPSLPSFKWPFGGSSASFPAVGAPSVGGAVGRPEMWGGLLWVIVAVALALALWRVAAWRQEALERRRQADGWVLGAWPVNPAAVRTRQELVLAFEYLSLLLLGRPAQSWNHRQIADGMGGRAAEPRRRAADQLAGLYEHGRYAPPDDSLTEAELAAARRDLCYLAGVPAA